MKKTFKKLISVILCAVLLFTTASTAFAAEDNSQTEIVSDAYELGDVLIVTFDSVYYKIGEIPNVTVRSKDLFDETVKLTQVSKDRIYLDVYEYEGKQYPQMFIDVDFCRHVLSAEIGEGAFITESGEHSSQVNIEKIKSLPMSDKFDVECQFKGYFIYDDPFAFISGDKEKHNYTVIGTSVKVETFVECDYAQLWEDDVEVKYTVNGKTVEITSGEFVPEEIGELNSMLFYVDLSYNNLSGGIPANLVLTSATVMMLGHNRLNGYIPDAVAFSYIWKYVWDLEENLQQQAGFELTYSDSQGYSRDCELLRLQQHTKGNGIKVVISGDGYTESMIEDGTYETTMREAMEGFFSKEPYTTYRDYFDIYAYFAVSADEGIGGNTAFKTRYRENDRYVLMDDDLCIKRFYAAFSEIGYDLSDVTAIVVLNDEESWGTYNCTSYSDGFSLSNTNKNALFSVLVHEANGHGFGFLADEYVTDEMTASPTSFKESHDQGKWLNVDGINDPEKIGWAYFLKDERYTSEKIGIYEGACYVRKGRFRATEMSMMNSADKDNFFNAPSRWGIYQRIMKLAGEDYSFEDFLEYDAVNRAMYDELEKTGRSVKSTHEKMNGVKNGPPVYKDYPTSEILLKNDRLIRSANR